MDIFFDEILQIMNNSIIEGEYDPHNHLILSKYTSKVYYKYSIELLKILLDKTEYTNKSYIFYMSLIYLLKILYNLKNIPYIDNYDLLILSSFSLGIKASVDQHKTPFITKLKNIYCEKYSCYSNMKIQECELICMKLLDYNINILTPYECLYFLFNKDISKFHLLINELDNLIFNNVNKILFQKPYELALEVLNRFNGNIKNIKQPILINKKTAPFLRKNEKKLTNDSTPTTSVSSSYGSCNNTRNNFNSKRLNGIRSQSNMIINNKNIIINVNNELNDIYKNNNFIVIRCTNSAKKEENNRNNTCLFNNNNEIKKVIYKNINFNNKKIFIKTNENEKKNNIKLFRNPSQKKFSSNDIYLNCMNTSANKNQSSKKSEDNLQKMEINKFLFFSGKKSPIKTNTRVSINENKNIRIKKHIDIKLINNLSSNTIRNIIIQKCPGNNIFKKPTLEKQKIKTSFKNKNNVKNINNDNKKENNFNTALKNCNIHYRKITDLCKKINFDVLNSISDKEKTHS
jgi:hypothetical protein